MSSPLSKSPSNENEIEYPIVREYECQKGLKRVEGLGKDQLQTASTLGKFHISFILFSEGILQCAVTLLLSDKHLEFCVVFDTKSKFDFLITSSHVSQRTWSTIPRLLLLWPP
jgi:hypothetical protein